ncbi:MAG: VWA domain-containing protein [Anaerolineae bacterium]|nr:VWA domain-containing protein [Gemmatimonadaceae bacterium]
MSESVFEFLFKYRPAIFQRGELTFATPNLPTVILCATAVIVIAVLTYSRGGWKTRLGDRLVLGAARLVILGLVLFALLRPTLIVSASVPQRNLVGVLIDDSRSMRIADVDGKPRSSVATRLFGAQDSALFAKLSERFGVRVFRFSRDAERVASASELTFAGRRTEIATALEHAVQALGDAPVAGIVLLTDGGDNSAARITDSLLALKARRIPVFTVGVGEEHLNRDVEISRVELPRSVLLGSSLLFNVLVTQRGFSGDRVKLQVEDGGRIVATEDVTLGEDGATTPVRLRVSASEPGPRRFRFRIAPLKSEQITQNNDREALVVVRDEREKILYVEGEPRFEIKYLRRAVAGDSNLQVVGFIRTAKDKFLRLDVDDAEELAAGFPKTREELFKYRGIILGSMEASFFTHDQLRMLADFVGERGGGLLMLGGAHAFAEGGYGGTPLGNVLPVMLPVSTDSDSADAAPVELSVTPTDAARSHAATQIGATERESADRWKTLPPLSTVNRIGRLKPGATSLLTGSTGSAGSRQVVLAHQRYGRGKAIALAVQDSWFWQMHADIPVDDMTHETFWRQMLRWLVSDVSEPVSIVAEGGEVAPGETVHLLAEVRDSAYLRVNGGEVVARVTAPSGTPIDVPLRWTVERDGEYRGSFLAEEEGAYSVRAELKIGDTGTALSDTAFVPVAESQAEFFDAAMRAPLLQRIARETGGRFYRPDDVGRLPEDLSLSQSGATVLEQKELWDMPAIFLLLSALVGAEWGYRRYRRLA